jgi:hypothetical protein
VLGRPVARLRATTEGSNWSQHVLLDIRFEDGATVALRLKLCSSPSVRALGSRLLHRRLRRTRGRAAGALPRCALRDGVGYHLLLDDLAATHRNRRDAPPTLEYGLAVAEALARLHVHHWEPRQVVFSEIGIATGKSYCQPMVAKRVAPGL